MCCCCLPTEKEAACVCCGFANYRRDLKSNCVWQSASDLPLFATVRIKRRLPLPAAPAAPLCHHHIVVGQPPPDITLNVFHYSGTFEVHKLDGCRVDTEPRACARVCIHHHVPAPRCNVIRMEHVAAVGKEKKTICLAHPDRRKEYYE